MTRVGAATVAQLSLVWFAAATLYAVNAVDPEPVSVEFFYSPGCRMCADAANAVDASESRWAGRIQVQRIDTTTPGAVERLFNKLDAVGATETESLTVFVDDVCLSGGDDIVRQLDSAIADALERRASTAGPLPSTPQSQPPPPSSDRLGFWAISVAGLADGINPCAFATVVLFASMLTAAGRSRRAILLIGGCFALTVYATYFVIGILFFNAFAWMRSSRALLIASDIVYLAAVASCVLFGILSAVDAVRTMRGGSPDGLILALPPSLKTRIARRMSRTARSASMVAGAIAAGAVVSLLESVCTGQIYFPIIAGLARTPGRRWDAALILLWYNFLFILPLAGVIGATAFVLASERIAALSRKRRHWTKAALAVVFFLLAVWLAGGVRWPIGG